MRLAVRARVPGWLSRLTILPSSSLPKDPLDDEGRHRAVASTDAGRSGAADFLTMLLLGPGPICRSVASAVMLVSASSHPPAAASGRLGMAAPPPGDGRCGGGRGDDGGRGNALGVGELRRRLGAPSCC